MHSRDLTLTELDSVRLSRVLNGQRDPDLAERVEAAQVVPGRQIDRDIVTMNSRVTLEELPAGGERTVTLVYPGDGSVGNDGVSVLSPLGRALLGARVGEEIDATLPGGAQRRFMVQGVPYQPEAAGDYAS
jgi:regulator of nucleoside diphosphate kinase